MKKIEMELNSLEKVEAFVNMVSKYDFDMDLRGGRHVVDAKSIMGIFSLKLNKPVVLEIYDEGADPDKVRELETEIQKIYGRQ